LTINIARKLLKELKIFNEEAFMDYYEDHENLEAIIETFEEWIEKHDKVFDHSALKPIWTKDFPIEIDEEATKKLHEEWHKYHDEMMEK
jgi:aspartyl-tRNA synthetase